MKRDCGVVQLGGNLSIYPRRLEKISFPSSSSSLPVANTIVLLLRVRPWVRLWPVPSGSPAVGAAAPGTERLPLVIGRPRGPGWPGRGTTVTSWSFGTITTRLSRHLPPALGLPAEHGPRLQGAQVVGKVVGEARGTRSAEAAGSHTAVLWPLARPPRWRRTAGHRVSA